MNTSDITVILIKKRKNLETRNKRYSNLEVEAMDKNVSDIFSVR